MAPLGQSTHTRYGAKKYSRDAVKRIEATVDPKDVDWRDREQVKAWLETQERDEVIAFAARAALRVAPFIFREEDLGPVRRLDGWGIPHGLELPSFRAMLVSSTVGGAGPAVDAELSALAGSIVVRVNALATVFSAEPAARAADAALAAARAARADIGILDMITSANAITPTANAAADASTADAAFLAEGETGTALLTQPLWIDGAPDKIALRWRSMADALRLLENQHWQVWIDWYDDRLIGKPLDLTLHRNIALIPDEDWKQGPEHVNPMIADMVAANGGWNGEGRKEKPVDGLSAGDVELTREEFEVLLSQDTLGLTYRAEAERLVLETARDIDQDKFDRVAPGVKRVAEALQKSCRGANDDFQLDFKSHADEFRSILEQPFDQVRENAIMLWVLSIQIADAVVQDSIERAKGADFARLTLDQRTAAMAFVTVSSGFVRAFKDVAEMDSAEAAFRRLERSHELVMQIQERIIDKGLLSESDATLVRQLGALAEKVGAQADKAAAVTDRSIGNQVRVLLAVAAGQVLGGALQQMGVDIYVATELGPRAVELFRQIAPQIQSFIAMLPHDIRLALQHALDTVLRKSAQPSGPLPPA